MKLFEQLSSQLQSQVSSVTGGVASAISSASAGLSKGLSLDQLAAVKASASAAGRDPYAEASSAINNGVNLPGIAPSSGDNPNASADSLKAFKLPSIARLNLQQLASEKIKPETLSEISAAKDAAKATASSATDKLAGLKTAMLANPIAALSGLAGGLKLPSLPSLPGGNPLASASIVTSVLPSAGAADLAGKLSSLPGVGSAISGSVASAASSLAGALPTGAASAFNAASAATAKASSALVSGLLSGAPNVGSLASAAGSALLGKADAFAAVSASAASVGKVLPNVKGLSISPDTILARAKAAGLSLPTVSGSGGPTPGSISGSLTGALSGAIAGSLTGALSGVTASASNLVGGLPSSLTGAVSSIADKVGGATGLTAAASKVPLTPDQKSKLLADAKDKGIAPALALANAALNGVQAQLSAPSTFSPPKFPDVMPKLPSLSTSMIPNAFPTGISGALSSLSGAAASATAGLTGVTSLASGLAATAGQAVDGISSQLLASTGLPSISGLPSLSGVSALAGGQAATLVSNKLGVIKLQSSQG